MTEEIKRGAPVKRDELKIDVKLNVKISKAQREVYKAAAKIENLSYSDWVRDCLNERAKKIV